MFNGKFRCTQSSRGELMKKDRIYEAVDGCFTYDNGVCSVSYESLAQWNNYNAWARLEPLQPNKALLKNGDKIVLNSGSEGYVLLEVGAVYAKDGKMLRELTEYDEGLVFLHRYNSFNVKEVWRGQELIMQRDSEHAKNRIEELKTRQSEIDAERIIISNEIAELSRRL